MHIDEHQFGRIVIDGAEYMQDVIIFPAHVQGSWWRREGHHLHIEDLSTLLESPPEVLIIGRGFSGFMRVPDALVEALQGQGMAVHVADSREAVALYNRLAPDTANLAAAIHLTC